MKHSKSVAVLLLSCFQFAAPTLARGDGPRDEAPSRMEILRTELPIRAPSLSGLRAAPAATADHSRVKTLSLEEFTEAFHNPKVTYNDVTGEVSFKGTTAESCMDHFNFSRGEASTDIVIKFRYVDESEKTHCLDKDQIKCEKENCAGLRNKEDAKVKLGKESGDIRIVYNDLYNQDELSSSPITKDGTHVYHKGALEIAKEKADAAEKAKSEKIAADLKALNACCTKTEQEFSEKRGLLADLEAIEAVTSEEKEKYEQKIDLDEMNRITAEIKKARLGSAEGEESELELLKERLAGLMDKGDPAVIQKGKLALADIVNRKLKDVTVDPATASNNALEELSELRNSGFEFSAAELAELQQVENKLNMRKTCLTVAINSPACRTVVQEAIAERTVAVPQIGADGKFLNPAAAAAFAAATSGSPNTQPAGALNANIPDARRPAIPANQTVFGQFGVPNGFPAFTPNTNQASNFGIINSGYQLNTAPPQNGAAPGTFIPR